MEPNHKLCLYVSFYLSKFNEEAYKQLGFKTMYEAHAEIGRLLNMNPHTVKNMRDQFDPLFGHRVGWYQAPLSPSRVKIVEACDHLTEFEMRQIVTDILFPDNSTNPEDRANLLSIVNTDDEQAAPGRLILRGPTGRKAEDFFIDHYNRNFMPVKGTITDTRDLAAGYDFCIDAGRKYYVEVKGLADETGGVLFTGKEWEKALEYKDDYYLALVSGLGSTPVIRFIKNPAAVLRSVRNIIRTVQINWSVSSAEIKRHKG